MRKYVMGVVAPVLCAAGASQGGVILPADILSVNILFNGNTWSSVNNPGSITGFSQNAQGQWIVEGAWSTANWSCDWAIEVDQGLGVAAARGPFQTGFVVSSFNFTNTTGNDAAEFQLLINANVAPLSAPTTMTGSLSGSLGSGNPLAETAMLRVPTGDHLYTALIDGTGVRTMVDDSFSLSTNLTAPLGSFNFFDEPGPGVASTLGLRHSFGLTDGDNVNFVGAFVVTEIPAPGAAALFGLGGLAAARRRR